MINSSMERTRIYAFGGPSEHDMAWALESGVDGYLSIPTSSEAARSIFSPYGGAQFFVLSSDISCGDEPDYSNRGDFHWKDIRSFLKSIVKAHGVSIDSFFNNQVTGHFCTFLCVPDPGVEQCVYIIDCHYPGSRHKAFVEVEALPTIIGKIREIEEEAHLWRLGIRQ